ncbi:tRNA (N6-threonylcarbamoyladenosine(37)-N6)-methyltransferase TrmO [Candidatus Bathyarchaeota archaeon]|nr:tRNA (N6-threonylcarbamoyladenosine(37)-N6)-methyltransferase TrmO [Candidatus Bathyarchaeota archaeon]
MWRNVIEVKPIGFVKREPKLGDRAKIVLAEELAEGLEGIEGFSHIYVIFWLHKVEDHERRVLKVHPRGIRDLPLVGVFATRSPMRPNPIGLTLVELVERRGNVLIVRGLDALDGTPVLDIKPFVSETAGMESRLPDWFTRLKAEAAR